MRFLRKVLKIYGWWDNLSKWRKRIIALSLSILGLLLFFFGKGFLKDLGIYIFLFTLFFYILYARIKDPVLPDRFKIPKKKKSR